MLVSNAYAEQLTQLRLSKLPVEVTILAPAIDAVGSSQRYKIIVSGFTLAVICGLLSALGRLAWDESAAPIGEPASVQLDQRIPKSPAPKPKPEPEEFTTAQAAETRRWR